MILAENEKIIDYDFCVYPNESIRYYKILINATTIVIRSETFKKAMRNY